MIVSGSKRSSARCHGKARSSLVGRYRFRRADGSYADILDRGYLIYDSSMRPTRMMGAMTDISERKRAVEILEERVATRTVELRSKN